MVCLRLLLEGLLEQFFGQGFSMANAFTYLDDFSFLLAMQVVEVLEGHRDRFRRVTEQINDPVELAMIAKILSQVMLHLFDLQCDLAYLGALH